MNAFTHVFGVCVWRGGHAHMCPGKVASWPLGSSKGSIHGACCDSIWKFLTWVSGETFSVCFAFVLYPCGIQHINNIFQSHHKTLQWFTFQTSQAHLATGKPIPFVTIHPFWKDDSQNTDRRKSTPWTLVLFLLFAHSSRSWAFPVCREHGEGH